MSENSIVVITGANRGIGLELARLYAGRGCSVIGVCREASPELEEVDKRIIESVDVTTDEGVAKLVAGLEGERIDLLINNAGLLQDEKLGSIDFIQKSNGSRVRCIPMNPTGSVVLINNNPHILRITDNIRMNNHLALITKMVAVTS